MENFIKNYNLSIVLFFLFLFSWIGQGYFQWNEFIQTRKDHNRNVAVQDYMNEFGASTLENWQSEFLQLFTMVVLTSFLIHKGSSESRDSQDEMMAKITKIEKHLEKKKRDMV